MPANLLQIVETTPLDAEKISDGARRIHAAVLGKSEYIDAPNFQRIHPDVLDVLFVEYDN